jgi:subtilisin family serine protease
MILTLLFSILSLLTSIYSRNEPTQRLLVEFSSSDATCLDAWWREQGLGGSSYLRKPLSTGSWWVIEIPGRQFESFINLSCVVRVYEDKKLNWRDTQPNDPAYINQSDMNLIGMTKAWDVATGGVTAQGDTIVVALIDDGYQVDHEDLVGNIWFNRAEIPDDGIDNDGNGYVDDYQGLNISLGNDHHPVRNHGTAVSGIVGARGNNLKGVSGVNWRVKLLLISQADFESELIESYEYILAMRKKYRETNGVGGAFVVVTNLSGGLDFAFAADHPLWCEMYDKLGEEGVLSVCAAPNNNVNVDVEGDMPTTCTSPYMIAVTNVDLTDHLVDNAGFGPLSIDLGAPGNGTLTTGSGDQYKEFPGTSASAPHVAGTIALMYSTTCATFLHDIDSDPSATATRIKNILLTSAKPNNSLNEITLTGKRLQADAALKATITNCGEEPAGELEISSIYPNPVTIYDTRVFFRVNGDTTSAFFELYTTTGARIYHRSITQGEFTQGFIEFNAGALPAGIYLVTLRNSKAKVTRKFFVF